MVCELVELRLVGLTSETVNGYIFTVVTVVNADARQCAVIEGAVETGARKVVQPNGSGAGGGAKPIVWGGGGGGELVKYSSEVCVCTIHLSHPNLPPPFTEPTQLKYYQRFHSGCSLRSLAVYI